MNEARRGLGWLLCSGLLFACGQVDEPLEVGVTTSALNACNETVPDNRNIDGIPSYAQCPEFASSAIYSNNGVDTAPMSMGAGWVRTQYSGGYQCTELAHRYLHFKWGVKWIPNGNAGSWCDTMPPANSGMVQTMAPVHGDLMVLAPGSCGAAASTGHVTVVDIVDTAKAKLTVVEQNGARRGTYNQSCAKCFLHVVANDGAATGAPIAGSAAPQPPAAGSAAPPVDAPKRPAPAGAAAPPPPAAQPPTPVVTPTPPAALPAAPAAPAAGSAAPAPASTSLPSTSLPAPKPDNVTAAATERSSEAEAASCSLVRAPGATTAKPWLLGLLGLVWFARKRRSQQGCRLGS
jgi:MYXO-CTERM domain-containing protein